jgi:uncharacterized membrane protein
VCGLPQVTGSANANVPPGAGPNDFLSGLSPRNASLLCYIPMVGWIAAIVLLASPRFRNSQEVRFNAFQGLYLFVAWLIVDWVVSPFLSVPFGNDWGVRHVFSRLLKTAVLGVWIFMIVKVSQGQSFRLPILGELAERSVAEQR